MIPDVDISWLIVNLTIWTENRMPIGVPKGHVPSEKTVVTEYNILATEKRTVLVTREVVAEFQISTVDTHDCTLAKRSTTIKRNGTAISYINN